MTLVSNQIHVGCIVATVVLGRSAKPFQREVERFIRYNGLEWTSTRLKAIWTAANHLRNGNPKMARTVYQENYISYHKSDMTPKGAFRPVVRGYRDAMRPSVIRRYAAVLRFYTTLVLPRLSEKQREKALSSISDRPVWNQTFDRVGDFAYQWGKVIRELGDKAGFKLKLDQTPYNLLSPNTYRYSRIRLDREDRKVPLRSLALSLMTESFIPADLDFFSPFPALQEVAFRNMRPPIQSMGRIGFIQEQGAKARVVAMPSAQLQYAFLPLHNYLMDLDRICPMSVVRDQSKAIYGLYDHMAKVGRAYSTDLSSATDRFPRSISCRILDGLGLKAYSDGIDVVSSQAWDTPWGQVHYGTGQPMGLYGSFPLFHLTNQMMVDYAVHVARPPHFRRTTTFPNGKCAYVLGDDVVFSDYWVASAYRRLMSELGVPISEQKSFSGGLVEFAGFVVTRAKGNTPFGFRPYKPPQGRKITNPIDFLAAMGTRARVISKIWAERVETFARTWSDRSPDLSPWYIPQEEAPSSSWDAAALDNEFQLLSSKYPLTPELCPGVHYSSGALDGYRTGLDRDMSKDIPRVLLETSRVRLGEQPKHPRRVLSPYQSDPLIRKAKIQQIQLDTAKVTPQSPPPGLEL